VGEEAGVGGEAAWAEVAGVTVAVGIEQAAAAEVVWEVAEATARGQAWAGELVEG
jgi:hypothetical protein